MIVVCALHSTGVEGPLRPMTRALLPPPPLVVVGGVGAVVGDTEPPVVGEEDGTELLVDALDSVVDVVGDAFLWLLLHAARTMMAMTSSTRRTPESYGSPEGFWF